MFSLAYSRLERGLGGLMPYPVELRGLTRFNNRLVR